MGQTRLKRHRLKIAVLTLCVLALPTPGVFAADTDADTISNVPMEVRRKAAPANIMFIIDNSGSMDAEFATDEMWGYFHDNGAVFWYPFAIGDTAALLWRARWHGANRMFYDPNRQYGKWPGFDAPAHNQEDIGMAQMPWVRNDPRDANAAFNLSAAFHSSSLLPGLPAIPNSHYYVWHDADADGVVDDKEVWLVTLNFVEGGAVERHYFNFDLANDGVVTDISAERLIAAAGVPADMRQVMIGDNELLEVPEAAVPTAVKAHWTKDDGTRYEPNPQEELLNFATWYTYHRKRSFAAIGAVSETIGRLSGVQVGLYTINGVDAGAANEVRIGVQPVKVDVANTGFQDRTDALRSALYRLTIAPQEAEVSTPLNTAFLQVARYFDVDDTGGFAPAGEANTPYASAENGGACQQAFVIIISDGEYTDTSAISNAEGDGPFGPPYHDNLSNTLADLVMHYYNTDLAKNLDDNVPVDSRDGNKRQHIVTYTIGFGVQGTMPPNDMDRDGKPDPDGCTYAENPYFTKENCTVLPAWPTSMDITNAKVDDLWHAAVNGHGQYFQAANAKALVDALSSIAADIASRQAIGASGTVNSGQLNDNTTVYIGRYNANEWTGDLLAYTGKKDLNGKITGEVDVDHPKWRAAEQLASNPSRIIFTSNGDGAWLDFTATATGLNSADFSAAQRQMLTIPGGALTFTDSLSYFRGQSGMSGVRKRGGDTAGDNVLGDIVHSSPVLMRTTAAQQTGTIFVGANDGMLHAFDAQTGAERFAFIPSLVHDHLVDLSKPDYAHRYYVDASPVVEHLAFFDGAGLRTTNMYLLVSGLGRGGKGYFALDVSEADAVGNAAGTAAMVKWEYPSRSMSVTGLDSNGDGRVEGNTAAPGNPLSYTYRYEAAVNDGRDNDGDGDTDEADEKALFIYDGATKIGLAYRDDDLGYSYSIPVVVRCYLSANRAMPTGDNDHPWVVIFGNGYDSYNGKAVLYVLDALSGKLIRKIDTGVGGEAGRPRNGLSSPAVVDVDDDGRADFAYAGDLRGNLWKFDLRSNDPAKWRVAHEDAAGRPQPMFTTAPSPGETGQAITTLPQVAPHNKKSGYMVVFGTGKFLNETDRADNSVQTLFGIWDNDAMLADSDHIDNDQDGLVDEPGEMQIDRKKYLGIWRRGTGDANSFSNHAGYLLKQEVVLQKNMPGQSGDATIRVTSANARAAGSWWSADNTGGYMGWYFDLPGRGEIGATGGTPSAGASNGDAAERIVKDLLIRDGKVIAVTFIPSNSACNAGGYSFLMELSLFTGDRPATVQLDIDGDGKLTANDLVSYGGGKYAASGYGIGGMANTPVFTGGSTGSQGDNPETETMLLTSSSGAIVHIEEAKEASIGYWWEMTSD